MKSPFLPKCTLLGCMLIRSQSSLTFSALLLAQRGGGSCRPEGLLGPGLLSLSSELRERPVNIAGSVGGRQRRSEQGELSPPWWEHCLWRGWWRWRVSHPSNPQLLRSYERGTQPGES